MKVEFQKKFIWGCAISAFQTEMGASEEAKFEGTDWYQWTHSEEIKNEGLVSGDLPEEGDGFYDLYRTDINNARSLGCNAFRLSIEWGRLFPNSTESIPCEVKKGNHGEILDVTMDEDSIRMLGSMVNKEAVKRYKEILTYIRSMGMKVFLTAYHWPLPSWLHDPVECHKDIDSCRKRGWLDEKTIIEYAKYVYYIAREFSDLVDVWETINEPEVIASQGYFLGPTSGFPPAVSNILLAMMVEKNLSLAHSVAYRIMKKEDKGKEVGIGFAFQYFEPATAGERDKKATEFVRYMSNEWILNLIVKGLLDEDGDGVAETHLDLPGTDYIGLDYYQRVRVSAGPEFESNPFDFKFEDCLDCTDFKWDIYPQGLENVLSLLYEKYGKPIYILENGIADERDEKRGRYIEEHIKFMAKAMAENKIPVLGYFHWSIIDNFEWADGFSMRFGLFGVDYKTKERVRRRSADVFERICKRGFIDV